MTVEVFAPAKINLTLHVTGQRSDGYHLLDSLVVFANFGDRLCLTKAPELGLSISGPFADGLPLGPDNLVWRAAQLAGGRVHIELEKNLPPASGIGGGSSDAAATLRGMQILHPGGHPSDAEVLGLGADVPACLRARPLHMTGIGEGLDDVAWPDLAAVLVNPGVSVPTPAVFERLHSKTNPPQDPIATGDPIAWLAQQRNDLEPPACALAPEIDAVLSTLNGVGAQLARMSGSGATCFGVFATDADAQQAARDIQNVQPRWWVQACVLGTPANLISGSPSAAPAQLE